MSDTYEACREEQNPIFFRAYLSSNTANCTLYSKILGMMFSEAILYLRSVKTLEGESGIGSRGMHASRLLHTEYETTRAIS